MENISLIYYFAPLVGGLAIAFLPGINNYIARTSNSVTFTLFLNFSLGTIILGTLYFLFYSIKLNELGNTPLWLFLGGVYGTLTVAVMTITPSKIGIGKTLAIFITARLISATVIEGNGWLNMQQNIVTVLQILGIIISLSGTFLVLKVKSKVDYQKKTIFLYYFLCALSGIASSLQSSTNAALLKVTDDVLLVSWLNFSENLILLILFYLIFSSFYKVKTNFRYPGKIYFFGLLSTLGSLTVISMMAIGSLKVGVANTVILSVLTQLAMGTIIDHFGWLRVAQHRFMLKSFIGLAFLLFGVYLIVNY